MKEVIRFSGVKLDDIYKYSRKSRSIVNSFDEVNVLRLHDYIIDQCVKIEKTIFMRRKTKNELKINLIKFNVNSLINEFGYITMTKLSSTFYLPYFNENNTYTLEEFLEETILKITDECIPRDSIFKFKYYTSDGELKDNYFNLIKNFKPNEYMYEEYLVRILTDIMSRFIFLICTEMIENEKTVPLNEKIKEIYFEEEEK